MSENLQQKLPTSLVEAFFYKLRFSTRYQNCTLGCKNAITTPKQKGSKPGYNIPWHLIVARTLGYAST